MQPNSLSNLTNLVTTSKLFTMVIILVGTILFLYAMNLVLIFLARKFSRYRLLILGFYPIVRLATWVGAIVFIIVDVFKPPMNTVLALSASVGLAVGLGAQDLIRNIIAGIILLMERPFRVGDMIKVGEDYGEVVNIGLRSVAIHTFDDSVVTIPNALVLNMAVSNSNSGDLFEMVVVEINLPAAVDIDRVKVLARDAATSSPYTYLKKPISVLVEDVFQDRFVTRFRIKAYVLDVRYEKLLASDILERIKKAVLREGVITQQDFLTFLEAGVTS